ncbi:LuxR family transcriptional regulator [Salmonella enterica]|nr:LuxR family transcriptional regulator [Salmonella enterica]EDC8053003.1 LuxR family transcriptional regulator [Salmonella enterica subsp. enterica serovar Muenchen]EAW3718793.1 LuxR family transcriptional regulator [Salmonella enterica]EAX8010792.1 LuxR family transcriptional regulator [Salmonella enterica]EAY7312661.1 LuxR family transcriptional regulator [Salmonella enterica]
MLSPFGKDRIAEKMLQKYIEENLLLSANNEYAYMFVSKRNPSDALIISSYPEEWLELYRAHNYQLTDPVVLTAFRSFSPFIWDENITLQSGLKVQGLFSRAKQYNICQGFTFVLHDHKNNLGLLSFTVTTANPAEQLSLVGGAMQMLLIKIHEEMYRLAEQSAADKTIHHADTDRTFFTPREKEVLYWASMGKTYGETATILDISVSTVKFHIRNVISRLGVSNVRQAIRLSIELALLEPAEP